MVVSKDGLSIHESEPENITMTHRYAKLNMESCIVSQARLSNPVAAFAPPSSPLSGDGKL